MNIYYIFGWSLSLYIFLVKRLMKAIPLVTHKAEEKTELCWYPT